MNIYLTPAEAERLLEKISDEIEAARNRDKSFGEEHRIMVLALERKLRGKGPIARASRKVQLK